MSSKTTWQYWVLLFALLVLGASIIFQIFNVDTLLNRLYGSLIGVVLTAIVTVFLLQGQMQSQEKREKSVKVFEKKQLVYHDFLVHLDRILQDGKLAIPERGSDEPNELIELILQLGYIKLHAQEAHTRAITEQVTKILGILRQEQMQGVDSERTFYKSLAEEIFLLVTIMRRDLYDHNEQLGDSSEKLALNLVGAVFSQR
ncbi:MAG: hypothetical protein HXM98_08185 [Porphyromonadaceae bacterium]|jgi:hypothetical protein|uniref:hypothetical protein n=1 Tax=Porphyromonas sp. TaxID=1924944 RepID=UPI001CACB193|nr:hypothetical protein [Porphyromonas sp.]MBF1290380.1 hypothetical protein [Porphyromonadaceae bacterium]MBF1304233.1 hypothetical protein [Porphyromonadaceae bacterium]MBF1405975.1 hypothetical protein [Porphyromonas sp.]MBS5870943.1 hypothetical protein [Porphyromonas sp.]